jgi:membrane protein
MGRRRIKRGERRGGASLAWDLAPLVVLASAGVTLLGPGRRLSGLSLGPGRRATSPTQIPRRSWKAIFLRTRKEFFQENIPMIAAVVAFYALLALFPGIAAFVALYGVFADVAEAERHLQALSFVLTPEMLKLVGDQMIRLASADKGGQSLAFAASLLVSLWSANGAVKAMMTGLTIAYDQEETRSYLRKTLVSLAFTLGFLVFVFAAIGLLAAGPAIAAFAGQPAATLFGWISWPVLLAGLTVGLALLYRFGPSRDPVRWRWITWGSIAVVIFWMIVSALFSLYVENFGHFNKTYGSLGAVIGFMIWIFLSMLVVLAGAELNAEIERQTAADAADRAPASSWPGKAGP